MARNHSIAAFIAGFGTSYLRANSEKKDRERQDKMDQIAIDRAGRESEDYNDKKTMEDKITNVPTVDYKDKTALNADGLQGAMPGVFADSDTAQNFQDNPNATPAQKAAVLSNYAKDSRSGANLNGQQFVPGDAGAVAVADPSKAVARPTWQVMQDKSRVYLESGKPEYQDAAAKMLEHSQRLKSQDYQQRISDARRSGLSGLLDLMHSHDNDELGIVNPKVQNSADGRSASLVGETPDGKPIPPVQFDLRNGSVEDQLTQRLLTMASPDSLGNDIINRIKLARENRKDDLDARKVDVQEKGIEASAQNASDREDRRDARQQRSIDAMGQRQSKQLAAASANNDGRVTLTQQSNNAEIQVARKRMTGMTADDVKAKTMQFLPNGRDNPNFDPMIAQAYRTANQRLVGADPQFDAYSERVQPLKAPAAGQGKAPSPADRFKADPSMRGMTMGKLTTKGWPVYGTNGQLAGYWR